MRLGASSTPRTARRPRPPRSRRSSSPTSRGRPSSSRRELSRTPAFTVPGGRTEPLDEMPLPDRALALKRWLEAHHTKTSRNVSYWLYQNAWIVTGAKLGWWRGAQALGTLVTVDRRAQQLWGIGA